MRSLLRVGPALLAAAIVAAIARVDIGSDLRRAIQIEQDTMRHALPEAAVEFYGQGLATADPQCEAGQLAVQVVLQV